MKWLLIPFAAMFFLLAVASALSNDWRMVGINMFSVLVVAAMYCAASEYVYRKMNRLIIQDDGFDLRVNPWGLRGPVLVAPSRVPYGSIVSVDVEKERVVVTYRPLMRPGNYSSMRQKIDFRPVDVEGAAAEIRWRVEGAKAPDKTQHLTPVR